MRYMKHGGMQIVRIPRAPFLRFSTVFLLLATLCLGALLPQLYQYNTKTVTVENQDAEYVSVKETVVSQTLYFEGVPGGLELFMEAPSGRLYEDAQVTFRIVQGDKSVSRTVSAQSLSSGWYELNGMTRGMSEGAATLSIYGNGFPDGTDVYCLMTKSVTSGLPEASYNDSRLTGPLIVKYDIFRIDHYFAYYTVMLAALVLCIAAAAFVLTFRRQWLERSNILYALSFCLIFLFVSLNNPLASFLGEPRSEMAYEFWYKAHEMGLWKSMMSLMSGESLVWLERLLMWVADTVAPVKYVFMAAQLLQLAFISAVCSMFCLRTFQRYFAPELRLLFCLVLGTSILFPSAYYFWAVSYWVTPFLFAFAFVDLDKLKRWQYTLALVAAVIMCVSRIYHAVFIPIALLMILLLGKRRGRRFAGYLAVIAAASAFEVVYSMLAGAGSHLSEGGSVSPVRILGNTLYYQIQLIVSLLLGENVRAELLANLCGVLVLVAILVWSLRRLIVVRRDDPAACAVLSLGMLSMGTIMINVITCGMTSTVEFPINYAEKVDWTKVYYQQADLHFSYAYFAVLGILLVLFYCVKKQWKQAVPCASQSGVCFRRSAQLAAGFAGAVYLCSITLQGGPQLSHIETDWRNIFYVTSRDSYYVAINVSYGSALISLEHNSRGMLYVLSPDGEPYLWQPGGAPYAGDILYQSADVGAVSDLEEEQLIALTVRKAQTNFSARYVAVFYDREGNEIARVKQANSPMRIMTEFYPDTPLENVYSIAFEYEDGSPAYVCDALQIGVVDMKS